MLAVLRSIPVVSVCVGQFAERSFSRGHPRNLVALSQLDPVGLHFRDKVDRDADLQIFQRSDVPQHHSEMFDGNRGRLGLALRRDVRQYVYSGHAAVGAHASHGDQHQGGVR